MNDHGNNGAEPIGRIQQQSLLAPQRPRSNELFWAVVGFAAKGKHKMELCGSDQRFDTAAIKREFPSANFQTQISKCEFQASRTLVCITSTTLQPHRCRRSSLRSSLARCVG